MRYFYNPFIINGRIGYPYVFRIREKDTIPNNQFYQSQLRGAIDNHAPASFLSLQLGSSSLLPNSVSSYNGVASFFPDSDAEAGIRAALEDQRIEAANRVVLELAKSNYDKLYNSIRDLAETRKDEEIKILLLPKLLDEMIRGEKDYVKRFNLQFLRDSFLLWLSSNVKAPI